MPKYSFKVLDKEGRARAGSVQAASLEAARQMIAARGLTVLDLAEAGATGPEVKLQYEAKKGAGGIKIEPAEPRRYRPTFWDYLEKMSPDSPLFTTTVAVLAILGSLYLTTGFLRKPPEPKNVPKPAEEVRFEGVGAVTMSGVTDYGDVTLVVDFPQVPYQKSGKWSDFQHPSAGRYKFAIDFQCAHAPTRFQVRALKPGYKEVVSKQMAVPQPGGVSKLPDMAFDTPAK